MTRRFVSPAEFSRLARDGRAGADVGVRASAFVLRADDDDSRVVRWVFSDGTVDRVGDTIAAAGWDLTAFRRNPVVLFGHDAEAPPIGRALNVFSDGMQLVGDVEFAPPEVYGFADTIYRLVKGGYLKAGSVGFLPGKYRFADDDDRPCGIDFISGHELLEFSIVPVPANPNALAEARAKGLIDRAAMRKFRGAAAAEKRPAPPPSPSVPRRASAAPIPQIGPAIKHRERERRDAIVRTLDYQMNVALRTANIATRKGRAWLSARLRHLNYVQRLWREKPL